MSEMEYSKMMYYTYSIKYGSNFVQLLEYFNDGNEVY